MNKTLILAALLAATFNNANAMGALRVAIEGSKIAAEVGKATAEGAKVASEAAKATTEGAKLADEAAKASRNIKWQDEAEAAEEAAKAISNLRKLGAYRFEYRGFHAIPDLERGGYFLERGNNLPVWVKNKEAAREWIDAFIHATK